MAPSKPDSDRATAVERAARRWRSKIEETDDGHWPWPGATTKDGYGVVRLLVGRRSVTLRANRVFWEAVNGPLPKNQVLRRVCDWPGCVNPDCHEAVTRSELGRLSNSPMGQNARKQKCLNGHALVGPDADVYLYPSGARECRICRRDYERDHYVPAGQATA